MKKILYFDCQSGISGDMTLAALVNLGVSAEYLQDELAKLNVTGYSLSFEEVVKNGITANHANVHIDHHEHEHDHEHEHEHEHHHHHDHRSHADIVHIIEHSSITSGAKSIAKAIFMTIATAEAKVHGTTVEDVHFHEVGAVDSIVDIVGTAICIDALKPDVVRCSVVNDGHGFTFCQHGKIPVPAPATMEIFVNCGVVFRQIDIVGELVTPTGAAIVGTLCESFGTLENAKITKIGYGAGTKNFDIPNVLRVLMCQEDEKEDYVIVIETNIDDQTPESLGFAMELLFESGAKDVFFTPIYMKKNRPGTMLRVICDVKDEQKITDIIFAHTSTIGVRITDVRRVCLPREIHTVQTSYGDVSVKVSYGGHKKRISPEFESAKKAAKAHGVSLDEVYRDTMEKAGKSDI